jgi:hypothetical protein
MGGCVQTFVFSLKASRGSVFVRETEAIVCHVVHGSSSYLLFSYIEMLLLANNQQAGSSQ